MLDLSQKRSLRRIYDRWPRLRFVMRELNAVLTGREPPTFDGWLMTTHHELPWSEGPAWFLEAADQARRFERSQPQDSATVNGLLWRHWNVAYTVHHAIEHSGSNRFVAVECGSGDGLTAHFAASAAAALHGDWSLHLYDAWAPMRAEALRPSEAAQAGRYGDLSFERTQRNLHRRATRIAWHRGNIPDTLDADAPETVQWLHIDLNAADATEEVLEFFWPRIPSGAVILLDDYGWTYYRDTRRTVDRFLDGKPGTMLLLPTGQGLYFR